MILFKIAFIVCFCHGMVSAGNEPTIDETIGEASERNGVANTRQTEDPTFTVQDMRLTKDQWEAMTGAQNTNRISKRKAVKYQRLWTNNTVPYIIGDGFSASVVRIIKKAMNEWTKYSCITFHPFRGYEHSVIKFSRKEDGCFTTVGMLGGLQIVNLQLGGCDYERVVAHELGHVLGFFHEQSRPDRDEYVRIIYENIEPKSASNFRKYEWRQIETHGVPYDYDSIMHYRGNAFSKYGNSMTIETIDPAAQTRIGRAKKISFHDLKLLNLIYRCDGRCPKKICPDKGFVGKDCRCFCKGQNSWKPVIECSKKRRNTCNDTATNGNIDLDWRCPEWVQSGQCTENPGLISKLCGYSCRNIYITISRQCQRLKCPNGGFVDDNCRCLCEGPNKLTPIIDCGRPRSTRKPKPTVTKTLRDIYPICKKLITVHGKSLCKSNNIISQNCKLSCSKINKALVTEHAAPKMSRNGAAVEYFYMLRQ